MFAKILKKFGYEKAPATVTKTTKKISLDGVSQEETVEVKNLGAQIRSLKTRHLNQLEEALEKVPGNAQFGGSALVLEDDKIKVVKLTTKNQAIDLVHKARRGELDLVF